MSKYGFGSYFTIIFQNLNVYLCALMYSEQYHHHILLKAFPENMNHLKPQKLLASANKR